MYMPLSNQEVVYTLQIGKSSSSLATVSKFSELAQATVRRVPGHSKIKGNEEVEMAARRSLARLPLSKHPTGHDHAGISSAARKSATPRTPK